MKKEITTLAEFKDRSLETLTKDKVKGGFYVKLHVEDYEELAYMQGHLIDLLTFTGSMLGNELEVSSSQLGFSIAYLSKVIYALRPVTELEGINRFIMKED